MLSSVRGDDWTVPWFVFKGITSSLQLSLCFLPSGGSGIRVPCSGDELQPSWSGWEGEGGGIGGFGLNGRAVRLRGSERTTSPWQRKAT